MAWLYKDIISFLHMQIADEIKATKDYREAAERFRESGYSSEGNVIDDIASDEDRHANLLMNIMQSIQAKAGPRAEYEEYLEREERRAKEYRERTGRGEVWELKEHYPEEYEAMRPERSGVIVTVTDPGNTSWEIGDTIASEEFDLENDKMRSLGKRPALGEYHY